MRSRYPVTVNPGMLLMDPGLLSPEIISSLWLLLRFIETTSQRIQDEIIFGFSSNDHPNE